MRKKVTRINLRITAKCHAPSSELDKTHAKIKRDQDIMGLDARKPFFGGLRKTKAQTSLRIGAV